ncbi:hypothetical protein GCM10010988_38820 [Cnuibacter physcomitrellae]|nr:hypothetical protein GCM10010988_38820 [Cnuibacter physcomitrellae]
MKTPHLHPELSRPHLARRVTAEFVGTGLLVTVVVGSGIAAQQLSAGDVGLQLLQNSIALGLGLLLVLYPIAARTTGDVAVPHPAETH